MIDEHDLRIRILANYLDLEPEDEEEYEYLFEEGRYDYGSLCNGNEEYLVLTDSEADDAAEEYIMDSLWAFNAGFLSYWTDMPEQVFTALQDLCEESNDTIKQLLGNNIDDFIADAISSDGRGYFISSYDGDEEEWSAPDSWKDTLYDTDEVWYIYRVN